MLKIEELNKIKNKVSNLDDKIISIFSVLGDRNRFLIIKILLENGELCVSDLASVLGISISAVSQHLRVLEMSGLVTSHRMGQMICYDVNKANQKLLSIINLI